MRSFLCALVAYSALAVSCQAAEQSVFISRAEIMALPTSGASWNSVLADANRSVAGLTLSDQNDNRGSFLFAKALVGVRTNNESMLATVRATCLNAMETENGGRTLALGRELRAVVIAADLAVLSPEDNATFCNWLRGVMRENLSGRTLISTHEDRPNNWGTHAGASRIAADIYLINHGTPAQSLEAEADLARAILVFKGFLGDRSAYDDFTFGDRDWQSDPDNPVGINPVGATIDGHNVDGVLPDDQRRGGGFTWPPPEENYVREALMGVVDQAEMLHRQGHPAFTWSDHAIRRAITWLHDEAHTDFSDRGDEATTHIFNFRDNARDFLAVVPAGYTRSLGYADWTHGPGRSPDVIPDPEEPGPTEPPAVPTLVVSPTSITATHKQFQTATTQLINVTSSIVDKPIAFTVASSQPWAVPSMASGTTPQGVNISFQTSSFAVGTHTATITLTGPEGAKDVGVTVTVTEKDPEPDPPTDPDPPTGGTTQELEVRVSASSDDAEERLSGSVSLDDGDTFLVGPRENRAVGIAFANVGIPVGATVTKAEIEFIGNEGDSEFCELVISAHAAGNAPTFIKSRDNISSRVRVAHSTLWMPEEWVEDGTYVTPDISNVVNAVVKRADWAPGNRIAFIFTHKSGTGNRVAENFRRPQNAAILRLEYTAP